MSIPNMYTEQRCSPIVVIPWLKLAYPDGNFKEDGAPGHMMALTVPGGDDGRKSFGHHICQISTRIMERLGEQGPEKLHAEYDSLEELHSPHLCLLPMPPGGGHRR